MNNHWLQIIDKRIVQKSLESRYLGERYAEVVFDLSHDMASHKNHHEDFSVSLLVNNRDQIQEIEVL